MFWDHMVRIDWGGGGVDSVNPEFRCWELLLEDF